MATISKFRFQAIDCTACAKNEPEFLGVRGGVAHLRELGELTTIVRCRNCTHQYANPMPFPIGGLNTLYADATEYFRGHNVEEKKVHGIQLIKRFEEKAGRKGTILDIGCGTGEIMWAAVQCGWNEEGVDTSSEFIAIGRSNLGVNGRICTLEAADFPSDHFDAILMSGIIEHLYDPHATLQEVSRVLKPGGWLWLDAPNEASLYSAIGNLYMGIRRKSAVLVTAPTFAPFHVQGFSPQSIGHLLRRSELDLKDITTGGYVFQQTGQYSLRKQFEYCVARLINWLGTKVRRGTYMTAWAQKPLSTCNGNFVRIFIRSEKWTMSILGC